MKKLHILLIALLISLSILALTSAPVEAQAANLSQFVFNVVSSPQIAGRAFSVTITAKASNGNTITSYSGVNALSVSSGIITPTSTTAFVAGVWTGQITLSKSGTGISISTSGGGKSGKSNSFTVNPDALDYFEFNTISSPQTAGKTFSITITAKDANSNTVTSYTGTNTLTASSGTINPTRTSAFVAGVWQSSVSLSASGSGITISTSGSSKSGTSKAFTVNPGALDHFDFSNIGTQTVGDVFNITITAKDSNGNSVTSYTGTNTLTASSGTINPANTEKFTAGVWTGQVTLSQQAGTGVSISTSGGGKSGKSNTFNVNAVALDHFDFNTISSPRTAGQAFSITITAKASNGNTVTSYTGSNTLFVSSGTIAPTSTTAFVAGVWTGQVTLSQAGMGISISTSGEVKSGKSNTFIVNPNALDHFVFNAISSPQTTGSPFIITIAAKDLYNNTVTDYTGSPFLTYSAGPISPIVVNAFVSGVASTSVTVNAAGSAVSITATDGNRTATSNSITVNPTINASANAGGTISPNGIVSINYGGSQTFSITANAGYNIADVVADNVSLGQVSSYTFTSVQASHTISGTFAPAPTPSPTQTNPPIIVPTPTPKPKTTPTPSPTPSPTPTPLATAIPTTIESGAIIEIEIRGNITTSQISNVTIASNQPNTITIVSFTITGPNATTGFSNMTIPKTAVKFGTTPVIYIDDQQTSNMGYIQDTENFYVWYTTQFSTHQVAIQFEIPSTLQDFSFVSIFAIGITVPEIILIYTVIAIKRLRHKPENV